PVRLDLLAAVDDLGARLSRALAQGVALRGQRLRDLARALPRPESLLATPAQRLDTATGRLSAGLSLAVSRKRGGYERQAGRLSPVALAGLVVRRREAFARRAEALEARLARRRDLWHAGFDKWASRLEPSLARLITQAGVKIAEQRKGLQGFSARLDAAPAQRLADLSRRLDALDRTRRTLGYDQTLRRGYAVVRGDGAVITTRSAAEKAGALELQFHDGRLALGGQTGRTAGRKGGGKKPPEQGSLF
ncbi:MAG: exodeoxyribonuclease VII large subunit, partial [Paracoccaceae bacterium]